MEASGNAGAPLVLLAYIGDPTPAADANIEFIGWAIRGSQTSDPAWRIARLFYDASGNLVAIKWANQDRYYVDVWDNRTGLTYA